MPPSTPSMPLTSEVAAPLVTSTPSPGQRDAARNVAAPRREVRVLHIINGEHYSGAERVQDLLAQQLTSFQYAVGFACLKPARFPTARQSQQVPLTAVPMRRRWDLTVVMRLEKLVREGKYELLHAHTPRSLLLAGLLKLRTGVPLVYHVHSPTSQDSTRRWQNWVNARIEACSLRYADRLICVSDSLGRFMQAAGMPLEKIHVVRNGVPPTPVGRDERIPVEPWVIGTVALFRPRKGLEVLLDAVAMLREAGIAVRVRAVGPFESDAYRQQILQRAEQQQVSGMIDWIGFTQDVQSELAKMDLFALPSLFGEGLPMVVLEAMAAGVPVVSTLVEGVPEAIRDGIDGVLAKPNDVVSFAGSIQRIIQQLDWKQLHVNAKQRHAECFSDEAMAGGVAAVYDRILRDRLS